jgi:hypothetical protein
MRGENRRMTGGKVAGGRSPPAVPAEARPANALPRTTRCPRTEPRRLLSDDRRGGAARDPEARRRQNRVESAAGAVAVGRGSRCFRRLSPDASQIGARQSVKLLIGHHLRVENPGTTPLWLPPPSPSQGLYATPPDTGLGPVPFLSASASASIWETRLAPCCR